MIDGTVAERLTTYLTQYYGVERTNCSTLAEYLRTGIFRPCDSSKHCVSISGGMNFYSRRQKVREGDVVALFYFDKRARSRRRPNTRKNYRLIQKHVGRQFGKLSGPRKTLSLEDLMHLCTNQVYGGYHFMYCIGRHEGQPMFIQQMGLREKGKEEGRDIFHVPVVVSVGMVDAVYDDVPAFVLIKRGR